jgi:hypothetical protein
MIDDEDLIEELRRYGEKNLPTLPAPGARITKRSNALTDQNREIYLKKLNHYRAREKAEQNPSKYLKQQIAANNTMTANTNNSTTIDTTISSAAPPVPSAIAGSSSSKSKSSRRSSARFKLENNVYYESTDDRHDDDDDEQHEHQQQHQRPDEDVIELDNAGNESAYEYVKVSNAFTSPLSTSTFTNTTNNNNNYTSYDDDDEQFGSNANGTYASSRRSNGAAYDTAHSMLTSTHLHPPPPPSRPSTSANRKQGKLFEPTYLSLILKTEVFFQYLQNQI